MEPEGALTKQDVLSLHQQGVPTAEILNRAATRVGVDPAATMKNMRLSELELLRALTPERGTPPVGEGEALRPPQMRIDMKSLEGRSAKEIADYMADMLGFDPENLRRPQAQGGEGLSNDQIIAVLGDPESVKLAPFGGGVENVARGFVRGIPSVLAGAGAAALTAPSGPIISGGAGMAAGAAAMPMGQRLEETVFGPRVPLVPGQQFAGKVGDIVGAGIPFLFAPYAFTRGMNPQQLSVLANRTGRDLTPGQSIAVQAVTRPKQAISSEALALTSSGFAGAAAANAFPGNDLAQMSAELAGGVLTPSQTMTDLVARAFGPAVRAGTAIVTRDPSRLSRRVVLRGPEGEERLLNLSNSVDRAAAATLRQAGWEQLPVSDPTGISPVMRMRSENALTRLVANIARDFQENPAVTAEKLLRARNSDRGFREIAAEYGISPEQLPQKLPVGAMVDSPSLRAIYATIQNSSEALGPTRARARSQELVRGFEGIENLVRIMAQTGDPQDFADAMRLQRELNETALNQMIDVNLARVTNAVSGFRQTDPEASQRASVAIANALKESLTLARRQENMLWNEVDRSQPLELTNTLETARKIMSDLGISTEAGQMDLSRVASAPLRNMLEVIDQASRRPDAVSALDESNPMAALEQMLRQEAVEFMGEGAEEAVVPTVRNALVLKRNLFDRMLAASSSANPDFGNARYYGRLYDSLMEDLGVSAESVAARAGSEEISANELALAKANSFSRALNDVFTRSFAGDALRRDPVGGYRIPPELLGKEVLSGRGDHTAVAMRDLVNSVDFVLSRVDLTPEEAAQASSRADTLRANQETLLKIIASRTIDPTTGEINLRNLQTLIRPDNPSGIAAALKRFPNLEQDLLTAETAQAVLKGAREDLLKSDRSRGVETSEELASQQFFQSILGMPPAAAIRSAIGEPQDRPADAAAKLRGLIRLANQNGGQFADVARAGLLDTVLDQALVFSGSNTKNFNFEAMRDYLFKPLGRDRGESNSVAGILREQGLLSDRQLADLNILLRQGRTIQQALDTSGTDTELRAALQDVSPLTLSMVGRFIGAAEGARIQRAMGRGGTIQIPGYFANLGARAFERIPTTSLQDTLVRFLDDEKFAEIILRRAADLPDLRGTRGIRAAQRLARDFQAALLRNGLIVLGAGESERVQRDGFPLGMPMVSSAPIDTAPLEAYLQSVQSPPPAPAMPAPPLRPTPAAGAPSPAAAPAAPPAAPRAGGARASYSALFPGDTISPLVQQRERDQGIGSLMSGPR